MGSSGSHPAASSILPDPGTATAVLAGDLLVIVGAMLVGELRHGVDPLSEPLHVLETLAPFLLGWVVLSLLLGAYDPDALSGVTGSVRVGAGAWIGAANVGLILRQSPYFQGSINYPFPLVVTGTVLVLLVAWRALVPVVLAD